MDRSSLPVREIAGQSYASETSNSDLGALHSFRTIEKLAQHLSVPMGPDSFQSLLARSLSRSTVEVPWLGKLRATGTGHLDGLANARATFSADDISEGEVVLLTHFLELLVAFIGPSMTLKFVRETWPQLSFDFSDFGNANND